LRLIKNAAINLKSTPVMRELLIKFDNLIGLDSEVLPTLLLRGWQIIAGGVLIFLIPFRLGQEEQGYYYAFASLLALQIFFELGMNQVILQMVSHEFAHVRPSGVNGLQGDTGRIDRLSSLVWLLRRWYRIAAILFFLMVCAGGIFFFSKKGNLPISTWVWVWVVLTFVTAINLYLSAMLTVLEGCGEIASVARMRVVQSVAGNCLMWTVLVLNGGLWAAPLVPMVAAAYTAYWLRSNGGTITRLRQNSLVNAASININWRTEIFPFQWRIAVSWVSGYFIFQLFTPIAFAGLGAVEAGRLGITMSIFTAVLTVGMSWVNAKLPTFAAYISRNERANLNILFIAVAKRSVIFTITITLGIIAATLILTNMEIDAVKRFASLPVILCLALVTCANCFIIAAAAYMRAHKEEPMMVVSVVTGLATVAAATFGSRYGVFTMMAWYAVISIFIALPWTAVLFLRYYRRTM
jgi:O-antigen/teichoic acid export membrane protein